MILKNLEILLILDFYSRMTLNILGYGYIQNFESNFGLKIIRIFIYLGFGKSQKERQSF